MVATCQLFILAVSTCELSSAAVCIQKCIIKESNVNWLNFNSAIIYVYISGPLAPTLLD